MKISKPSHATVVAYLALFVAVGGSAYAASKVGTKDLGRGAVTSPKIKKAAVRASDLRAPVVRTNRRVFADPKNGVLVEARCKKNERLVSGGGGWITADPGAILHFSGPDALNGRRAKDYLVFGSSSGPNELEARAVCLRK